MLWPELLANRQLQTGFSECGGALALPKPISVQSNAHECEMTQSAHSISLLDS